MTFILAAAFASANIAIYNPTNSTVDGLIQATNATGTFFLGNTNATANITGITCTVTTNVPGGIGGTDCSTVIASGNLTSLANSSTITYWITVPRGTAANNYTATITAAGTLGGVAKSDSKDVRITVNPSAALIIDWITGPSSIYQNDNVTATVNITNIGNVALNLNATATFANSSLNISYSLAPSQTSSPWSIVLSTSTRTAIGDNSLTVSAAGSGSGLSASTSTSRTVEVKYNYCRANSTNSPVYLEEIININDIEGNDFKPLDIIKLKVKVRNSADESKRVYAKATLVRNSPVEDADDEENQRISSDSSKTFNLNITIPADIPRGDAYIFVKVYDDNNESNCEQRKIKIYVDREDKELVFKDIVINPSTVSCEGTVEVRGSLINLGRSYEERVKLNYSDDLGYKDSMIYNDVDAGEIKDFSFTLTIPKNATEKSYRLMLVAYYEYNSDDNIYEDFAVEDYSYTVSGNCFKEIRNASASVLTSTAFIGKDSEVTIALSNTGNVQETYTINASSSDFLIKSITPSTAVLPAGSTTSVIVKLAAKEGIEPGVHSLNIGLSYSGKSETKTVSLNVQKASIISGWYSIIKEKAQNISWLTVLNIVFAVVIIFLVVKLFFLAPKKEAPKVSQVYKSNIKRNFK